MSDRQQFEAMIRGYFPNAPLEKDPDYPAFYQDPAIQCSWVGFQVLSEVATPSDTTNDSHNNHFSDRERDS